MKKILLAAILAISMVVTAYATSGYSAGLKDDDKKNDTTITKSTEEKDDDPDAKIRENPVTGR